MKYFSDINKYVKNNNRIKEIDQLILLCKILSNFDVKYWLDFGTLLGFHRDKNIIEYDIDIDLCIQIDNNNKYSFSYEVLVYLQDDFYIKNYIENKYLSIVPKNAEFNLYAIDIYFYNVNNKEKNLYHELFPNLPIRSFFVDELETLELFNYKFNVPRHLDLFLNIRYGNDWQTPIPDKGAYCNFNYEKKYVCYTSLVGDLFHEGHLNLLKRCSNLFDKVIVGVHNDEHVMSYKEKPYDSYEVRLENVKKTGLFDDIYENAPVITTQSFIDDLEIDFVVAGRESSEKIKKMYPVDINRLHLIERTPNISTSILKKIKLGLF
jgi:cytidyltransferase-like protein